MLFTQLMKCLMGVASMVIGINLWFAPQISEHWPKNKPGRLIIIISWFSRPGTASAFTPKEGTVQAWITSEAVTIIRIGVLVGNTKFVSVQRRRGKPVDNWSKGIMKESNLILLNSGYS